MSSPSACCLRCGGVGAVQAMGSWWDRCYACNGTGRVYYKTVEAANRRQEYLAGKEDEEQLRKEGFIQESGV